MVVVRVDSLGAGANYSYGWACSRFGMGGGDGSYSASLCLASALCIAPVSIGIVKNLVFLTKSCHVILSGEIFTRPRAPGFPRKMSFPKIIE